MSVSAQVTAPLTDAVNNPPRVCPARKLAGQTSFLADGVEVISLTRGRCWSTSVGVGVRICGDLKTR